MQKQILWKRARRSTVYQQKNTDTEYEEEEMAEFIARINLNYEYAQEHMEELGAFWGSMVSRIPAEAAAEMLLYRLTFATIRMSGENKEACRKMLKQAWESAYPGVDAISNILVAEHGEDQASAYLRIAYNQFYGVDELQELITDLSDTIPRLKKINADKVMMAQNFLLAIDSGCGFTSILDLLGRYMHSLGMFEFLEKKKEQEDCENPEGEEESSAESGKEEDSGHYIEIVMGAEEKNGRYDEDSTVDALKDEDNYEGIYVVGLDISYYLDGKKTDELRRLIRRLEEIQKRYIFVFRIPFLEKKALDEIQDSLTDLMMMKTVQIPPYPDVVLMENVWDIINGVNLSPDISIMDPVMEKIHREKMDGRFYGFKTVEKIAYEIIWKKMEEEARKKAFGLVEGDEKITAGELDGLIGSEKRKATGFKALSEMIGMEEIEERIREIVSQIKVAASNEKLDHPCIHMRFTGSPGTGKTTVARILGDILREEGILRKGAFFEYSARDLVAEYVGQTAVKTATICRDAYGSVLFIDEAYALYEGGDHNNNDYGREAITTLISEMENHRDDMLVVMAGYTDEMETLMKANPGIRSRMPCLLHFKNYTRRQLFDIFMLMVRMHFDYDPDLEEEALHYFEKLPEEYMVSKEFANARFVRNLYERTWSKGALRTSLSGSKTIVLTRQDFIAASGEKEFSEKLEAKKVLGFK